MYALSEDTAKNGNGDPVFAPLKRLYDEVANEPLPENLMRLLDRLDEAERKRDERD